MATRKSRATGCLVCGNDDGRFKSEEHIIAVALGNTLRSGLVESELVIPPGEICDKCNDGPLSAQDAALVAWPPISVFRSLGQIRNRRGNLVDAVAQTRWSLELDPADPRLFTLHTVASTGPQSGRDRVARALCKVALETRWLEDPADARSSRWDDVAAAAIGGPLPDGLVMGLTQPRDLADLDFTPRSEILVSEDPTTLRVGCLLSVVGLRLMLLLGSRPLPIPNTAWWVLDPETGSLRGPGSMWARFSGGAARAIRLDSPSAPEQASRSSRLPTHDDRVDLRLLPSRR